MTLGQTQDNKYELEPEVILEPEKEKINFQNNR